MYFTYFALASFVPLLCTLVFVLFGPSSVFCCSCGLISFNETMCEAKWVSHVRVLDNSSTTNAHINYTVRHLEVFKSPDDTVGPNQRRLVGRDTAVLTPIFGSMCGVTKLEVSKEFLLAGIVDKAGTLRLNLCLFVPFQDGQPNSLESGFHEWAMVPQGTKERLANWKSDECHH